MTEQGDFSGLWRRTLLYLVFRLAAGDRPVEYYVYKDPLEGHDEISRETFRPEYPRAAPYVNSLRYRLGATS